jgi:hypothetical protein
LVERAERSTRNGFSLEQIILGSFLNHAYTKLSEVFETWRIAHTGNIYYRMLYRERNGIWYPLDILRNAALVNQEQEIALKKMSTRVHRGPQGSHETH